MKCEKNANRVSNGSFYFDQPYNKTNSDWRHRSMVSFISLGCGNIARMREYRPRAFGTWAIFPQPREINLTIDLDASHNLYNVVW